MKKFITFILFILCINASSQENDGSIILPTIQIDIEDLKQFDIETSLVEKKLPDLKLELIIKPDFTNNIKIDLEKTLPEKIDSPEKGKPVDALMIFGYGLNNYLFADFSIFVKQFNPKISIHYLRESKETLWFSLLDLKNPSSLDDFNFDLIYSNKIFSFGAEAGYYAKSNKLQSAGCYDYFTKRIITADIAPSLKFNYKNDFTLRVLNTFIFTDANNGYEADQIFKRNDFNYDLAADAIYNQIFGNNHFFTFHAGYDFSYLDTRTAGEKGDFAAGYEKFLFNTVKAGLSYSTILKDSISLNAAFDFNGMFRGNEFYWYLLPYAKFGYNLMEYFFCYAEGGASLIKKPGRFWFKENNYVINPAFIPNGTHWYAKTGIDAGFPGWIRANVAFEFAWNKDGYNWELSSREEKLYTYYSHTYIELNLSAGLKFTYRDFLMISAEYMRRFYELKYLDARDNLTVRIKCSIPKTGLSLDLDFEGKFNREPLPDDDVPELKNIYSLNAGIDWNWKERFGFGTKFFNILSFQDYRIMQHYSEHGFEFLTYMRIGF